MSTFAEIIGAWPSVQEYAADVGVEPSLAAVWKFRDKIPDPYWKATADAAARRNFKGVTLALMATIAETKRGRGQDSTAEAPPQSAISDSPSAKPGAAA